MKRESAKKTKRTQKTVRSETETEKKDQTGKPETGRFDGMGRKSKEFLREHRAALAVLLALLLVRLAVLYVLRFNYTLWSDDASYINSGVTFAKTGAITMHENMLDGKPVYSAQIMPGMTVLIGLISLAAGEGWALWKVLKILWILMGTAAAWYVYRTVRLFAPKWCGVLAMLWLFRPDFIWMDNLILTETPFLLCLSAMAYYTLRMGKSPGWPPFWGCLVSWLLGLSLKANIALYPLFALAYLLLRGYDRKLLAKQCAAVACVAACFLVPWTVRNYVHFHAFIPLTYGAGNPTLQGTYQGTGYPPDEDFDYETSVDAVIRERYAEFYQEDGTVKPEYTRYISLRNDALKAKVRQAAWWKQDWKSMAFSYLIEKPCTMVFSPFYWQRVLDIGIDKVLAVHRLDFLLCLLTVVSALILKKRRLPVLFLAGTYLANIYIYAMTFAFDRYNASLMCLRFILTGLGLSLGLQLLERGMEEIHRFEGQEAAALDHPQIPETAGSETGAENQPVSGRRKKEPGRR